MPLDHLVFDVSPAFGPGPSPQWPLTHVRVPSHSQSLAHTPEPPPFHASFQW
jgi:hypothetical protein